MKTNKGRWIGLLVVIVAGLTGWAAFGAEIAWTGSGADRLWSNTNNWDALVAPGADDIALFPTNAVGTNIVDATWSLGGLCYRQTNSAWCYTDLAGNTLTVTGDVHVANVKTDGEPLLNSRVVISNGTFQIGASGAPADLVILKKPIGRTHTMNLGDYGALMLGPNLTWVPYMRDIYIGIGSLNQDYTYPIGILDLTKATVQDKTLRARTLSVGEGKTTSSQGFLKLAPGVLTNLTVTGTFGIGGGGSVGNGYGRVGVETNGYKLPANLSITVGESPSSRGSLGIGIATVSRSANGLLQSDTGGVFTAWLTNLRVGSGSGGTPSGTLDLRTMDGCTIDTLTGAIGTLGTGRMYLRNGMLSVSNSLTVGGGSEGLLQLEVNGASCGLDLAATATVSIASSGLIRINWIADSVEEPYWGLRWAGDHRSDIQTLQSAGRLLADASALGKYTAVEYDGSYTYIKATATPPPPTPNNLTWSGGAGAGNFAWSAGLNWLGGAPPTNPTPGVLTFADAGGTNVVDASWSVNQLWYHRTVASTCMTHLAGNTLTVTGSVNVANVKTDGEPLLNSRVVISNGTFQIGASGAPADLVILKKPIGRTHTMNLGDYGALILGPNLTWVPYMRDISIGIGSANQDYTYPVGILDLTKATVQDKTLRARTLSVGEGKGTWESKGYLNLAPGVLTNLTVTGTFGIGGGGSVGNGYGRVGVETNGYKLPANLSITVGESPSNRGSLGIGIGTVSGGNGLLQSDTGGVFTAWLTNLRVGSGSGGTPSGTLDLRTMDACSINVSNVWIGTRGTGRVYLPAGAMAVQSNLVVGAASSTLGLLELFGTQVSVGGQLTVEASGRVTNHVNGVSSGIEILNPDPNAFDIKTGGRVHVRFESPPVSRQEQYWGVKMAGDNQSLFQTYLDNELLTVDKSALSPAMQSEVNVWLDRSGYTYLGLPALPSGTMIMLR